MRQPDSIQVLLQVRSRREEIEEGKLANIFKRLKQAETELAKLSEELERITSTRLSEIASILPNTHHQAMEACSRTLWQRRDGCVAEIQRLKDFQRQQMDAYLSAHRAREVVENLRKRRSDAVEMEKRLREQKMNEDLFLVRNAAKRDTCI